MSGRVSISATSPGTWWVRPADGDVERAAGADQHASDILVAEAELDLLERALDQEGAEGVHDRSQPGERQAGADVDQQLLADADVDDPIGVAALDLAEELAGDLGVAPAPPTGRSSTRSAAVRANCVCVGVHRSSPPRGDDDVGLADGRCGQGLLEGVVVAPVDGDARASPRSRSAAAIRPGTAYDRRAVVDHHDGERVQAERGGQLDGLVVAALVELRVADQHDDPGRRSLGAQAERRYPTAERQPVTERAGLEISHPGTRLRSGWKPSGESKAPQSVSHSSGKKPLLGQHGVVGHRPVALGQVEPVAAGSPTRLRRHVRTRS